MEYELGQSRFVVPGDVIYARGSYDSGLAEAIARSSRPQLVLNTALGFSERSLDFLRVVGPLLVGLELIGSYDDDSAITHCTALEELNLNTDCISVIDWSELSNLRYLFAYAVRSNPSLNRLARLEGLHLYGCDDRHLPVLQRMNSIRSLRLSSPTLTRTPNLEAISELTELDIREARKLKDFSTVAGAEQLVHLTLSGCPRLNDLGFVRGLSQLRLLDFSDGGKIDSISPLRDLISLEELFFFGTTTIVDGDLTVLSQLPRLRRAVYKSRRHYTGAPPGFPTVA